jgi:hypothetical protein
MQETDVREVVGSGGHYVPYIHIDVMLLLSICSVLIQRTCWK